MTKLPEWNGKVKHVNEKNFSEEVLKERRPVLVDFWSPSCVPCRVMIPSVESIVDKYNGKVKVVSINVEDSPRLASRLGIQSLPNILLFSNGEVQGQLIGRVSTTKLEGALSPLL